MNAWLVVLAAGLGSYLFRLSVVTLADRITMPASLERATELIAPASFAAIGATGIAHSFVDVSLIEALPPLAAVGAEGYRRFPERGRAHAFYLGGGAVLWVGWLAAIVVGAVAGAQLPAWLHLEFVIPLYLIGEIVPKLSSPAARRAVVTAVLVALVALAAPLHLGVAIAIVAGLVAGRTRTNAKEADR